MKTVSICKLDLHKTEKEREREREREREKEKERKKIQKQSLKHREITLFSSLGLT